jgi:hypothetical protein
MTNLPPPQVIRRSRLRSSTTQHIQHLFETLDYESLGRIYCDEGGEAFWQDRQDPCRKFGSALARALKPRLCRSGRSLYVGAGVAELPPLVMEALELEREVHPYNLRQQEVALLNPPCRKLGITFSASTAESAPGIFDHLWLVSVLNDPERFPELSALSYNRADPIRFNPEQFAKEREIVSGLIDSCLKKLRRPALVTTSVEEECWITDWCHTHQLAYLIEDRTYPTALVGDPVCFIHIL